MKIISQIIAGIAAFALVFSCMSGCAQNDEQVMRDTITERLDSIKNLDEDVVDDFSNEMDLDMLTERGIDGTELMKSYLDGFDYEIDSIDIDGNTALVVVSLMCKSYSRFEENLAEKFENITEDENYQALSGDERYAYMNDLIIEALEETGITETEPITIEFQYDRQENAWVSASDSFSNDILTAMMQS